MAVDRAKAGEAGVTFRIAGDKATLKALKALPKKVRGGIVRKVIRFGAYKLLAGVADRIPVDTGTAKKALIVRKRKGAKRGTVALDVQYKTDKIAGNTPNQFFYPAAIEYGVAKYNRPPSAPSRRTYDQDGPKVAEEATREIAEGVTKAAIEEALKR